MDIYKTIIALLRNTVQKEEFKILIMFHYIIADMVRNDKLNPIVTELFIRDRKLNNLILQYQKNIRLNKFYKNFCYENSKQTTT